MRPIDADELKKCVLKWLPKDPCGIEEREMPFETDICVSMLMEIDEQPTIQPEIIYCKDCKHWIPYDWMFSEVWQSKNIVDYPEDEIGCSLCDIAMKANDFCSRGKKREVIT